MNTKPRHHLTDDDYAEMANSYEAEPPRADEIAGPIEVNPAALRIGRPTKGATKSGKTPSMTVRLPEPLRNEVRHRVEAGETSSESQLVRVALVEYFENHPVSQ